MEQAEITTSATGTDVDEESSDRFGAEQLGEGPTGEDTLLSVFDVVCDDEPERLGADSEIFTTASWRCSFQGESVRVDAYATAADMATAMGMVLEFYRGLGDDRGLDQLPMGCGENWGFGADFNATRDRLVDRLNAAGISADDCAGWNEVLSP